MAAALCGAPVYTSLIISLQVIFCHPHLALAATYEHRKFALFRVPCRVVVAMAWFPWKGPRHKTADLFNVDYLRC